VAGHNYPTVGSNFSNRVRCDRQADGTLTPTVLLEAAFNYNGNKIAIIRLRRVAPAL